MISFGAVRALSSNFVKLGLQRVPEPLQSFRNNLVDSFSEIGHVSISILQISITDLVHLFSSTLQKVVITVELVIESADYLLLLFQLLIN